MAVLSRLALGSAAALLCQILPCSGADPLAGRWEGVVQIPGDELTLVVDLAADKTGSWNGSAIIPGFGIKGLPLKELNVKGSEATFKIARSGGGLGFEAICKAHLVGHGSLTGDFTQGGRTAPLQLKQTGPAQVETAPRSTAITKDLEGEWYGEYDLFGYTRKVTLKLNNNVDKGATADFVVVGKRVNNLPVDLITQENNLITINSHETGIALEGRFLKEANEIRSTWVQGPFEVPFTLKRKLKDAEGGSGKAATN